MRRRHFLVGGLTVAAGLTLSRPSLADPDGPASSTPPGKIEEPVAYRFSLGDYDAFVVLDGVLTNPSVQPFYAPEADPALLKRILADNFLPTDKVDLCVNVLVLRDKAGDVIIIDPGCGTAMGPVVGHLQKGLSALGIKPEQVTAVVLTHAHPDHISGLIDAEGRPVFGKAKVYASKTEIDYWMGTPDFSKSVVPEEMRAFVIDSARKALKGVGSQLVPSAFGEILPGIVLKPAPGHTPGHALVEITSAGQTLLHVGDAVHLYALQFPHPEWTMAGDSDPSLAIKTRKALFEQASSDRLHVFGYHMPFPGLGHVVPNGSGGYRWLPQPWA